MGGYPFKAGETPHVRAHSSFPPESRTVTATESFVAQMRRVAAFVPYRPEIPFDSASHIHTLRLDKCCRCGENASRAEYRLDQKEPYRFCWACR